MTLCAQTNAVVPQTCGVGVLGWFRDLEVPSTDSRNIKTIHHQGGCDWLIVGFTSERPEFKKAFDRLSERYGEPVYQSPKRTNRRTGYRFFFCIWDTK
jgi:hypothetical protein